ncbi:MAG: hypothetical protein RL757_2272 [Bacteroidota bacterium]|jgi:hypothetical protein
MKDLKQLEAELTANEQLEDVVAYQVLGGAKYIAADDKRRERPGSTIVNRTGKTSVRAYRCADVGKE